MAGASWTDTENDLIVADYFAMLLEDFAGRRYNKAEHNRKLQQTIARSRRSIERKHQNISAVLQTMDGVWLPGYVPLSNFQGSLAAAVTRWLETNPDFLDRPSRLGTATAIRDVPALLIGYPPQPRTPAQVRDMAIVEPIVRKINFSGRDARNRALGRAGEALVLDHERRVLTHAGRPDLAKRVRWVSEDDGDGAGYDIASFSCEGHDRLIEVKTTNGWNRAPFYISSHELKVSQQYPEKWRLCRVWNFSHQPQAFELRPPLDEHVSMAATNYRANFRSL